MMYKRYERYKDSEIEWIGEVPEHWGIGKLKHILLLKSGTSISKDEYVDDGIYPIYGSNGIIGKTNKYNINKRSIIIGRVGASGALHLSEIAWVTDNALIVNIIDPKIDFTYLFYWLLSLNLSDYASKTAQPLITGSTIRKLILLKLPLIEQKAIANYLDYKTSEIDSLIADKEKLIEKLEEYKQSIITEAVTKGLNPDVKMKDSGIEWIGEIPEGWSIKKLKHVVRLINVKTSNERLPYIGLEHIESWTGKYLQPDDSPQPVAEANYFEANDVLFGKLRPYLAKAFMPTFNGRCSSEFLVLRSRLIKNGFLFYLVRSTHFVNVVNSSTYGAKMPRASWNFVGELFQPIPPENEQIEIYKLLNSKINITDSIIEESKDLINKLKSYRQSLIYEAVTGKIDVRDCQPERSEQLA